MRKGLKAFLALFLILMVFAVPVLADQEWSEEYYRVSDYAGVLTEREHDNLDENCVKVVSNYHMDVAGAVVHTCEYDGMTMEEFADRDYNACGFGYGKNRDGLMIVYDVDKNEMIIRRYGRAEEIFGDGFVKEIIKASLKQLEENGVWGVMYIPIAVTENQMKRLEGEQETTSETQTLAETQKRQKPWWMSVDSSDFKQFQNPDAPRLIDVADLFTDEEESVMLTLIEEIQTRFSKDCVIYTDTSTYGMDRENFTNDFYDYCGYGLGDENDGICLVIIMNQERRGFSVTTTGSSVRSLYTHSNASAMDERLKSFLKDRVDENGEKIPGAYGEGVIDWIGMCKTLFATGHPFAPDWYTLEEIEKEAFHDSKAARVTDETGLLTKEQTEELLKRCSMLSEILGVDVAIHMTAETYWMSGEEYAQSYYKVKGYGYGDDYSGILFLAQFGSSSSNEKVYTYVSGGLSLSRREVKRLSGFAGFIQYHGNAYETAGEWLDHLEHFALTGRVKRSFFYWLFITLLSLITGRILAGRRTKKAEEALNVIKEEMDADRYLIPGSLVITKVSDSFKTTRIEPVYSPVKESRSSGGSSSFSSSSSSSSSSYYHESSSSSSGVGHTTSGSDF